MFEVVINMDVEGSEVSDLRESVGWGRRETDYPSLFAKCLFWAGVRDEHGKLGGFGYITGPGIEHGYMEDILVHPNINVLGSEITACEISAA